MNITMKIQDLQDQPHRPAVIGLALMVARLPPAVNDSLLAVWLLKIYR